MATAATGQKNPPLQRSEGELPPASALQVIPSALFDGRVLYFFGQAQLAVFINRQPAAG